MALTLKKPIATLHKKEQHISVQKLPMKTKKTVIDRPYEKNRQAAAKALYEIAKGYEKVTYQSVYRNCYYSRSYGCWRLIGKAHDYSY